MMLPAIVNIAESNSYWFNFMESSLVSIFLGICLLIITRGTNKSLNIKQTFILTSTSWLITALIAALPF